MPASEEDRPLLQDFQKDIHWRVDDWSVSDQCCVLADDDKLLLAYLAAVFRARGYKVLTATTGKEALRLIRDHDPTFVLLDVAMPDLDGWQVLWVLRQTGQTRNVPVVMLTARTGTTDVQKAIDFGADDFISKPILPEDLVARVHQAIAFRG
jgi:DNA-binding response OmpR family regulator